MSDDDRLYNPDNYGCRRRSLALLLARQTGKARELTKSEAWKDFYDTAKEREAAFDRGVTSELMDHDRYVADVSPKLGLGYACPHGGAE